MTSLSFFFKRYHVLSMKGDIQLCQKRIDIPFRITHTISAIRQGTYFSDKQYEYSCPAPMSRIPDNKSLPVYANNGFSPLESAVLQTIMRNPDPSQQSEDDNNVCMCADAPAANSFLQPHIGGPFRIAMYSISGMIRFFSPPFVLQLQPCCHVLLKIHDQSHKHTVRVFHSWVLNPFTCSFPAASVCFFR